MNGTCHKCGNVHSPHSYTHHYVWMSNVQHRAFCNCGKATTTPHVVAAGSFNGNLFTTCLLCGGRATSGEVSHDSITELYHTVNGSYILPNGIVVLVSEDVEAYLNSTLVFFCGERV